jgi:hypothetical protein
MTPSPNDYACKQIFAGTGYVLIPAIDVRNRSFAGGVGIEEEKRLKIGCIVCWVIPSYKSDFTCTESDYLIGTSKQKEERGWVVHDSIKQPVSKIFPGKK